LPDRVKFDRALLYFSLTVWLHRELFEAMAKNVMEAGT
jgi:hypothetical protein